MLQRGSVLVPADNSGAKVLKLIGIPGANRKSARLGDIITVSVYGASSTGYVKDHSIAKAVIVRTKKEVRRNDGSYIRFSDNAAVVIDKDKIITGKEKGKEGKVLAVYQLKNKVLVEGVNKVKKHVKPGPVSKEGGIVVIEKPIDVSNVMYIDSNSGNPVRVGYKIVEGQKYRINKKSGEIIGKA